MTTQLPPAGWYPDPAGQASFRYWDGQRWTDGPPPPTPEEKRDTTRATSRLLLAAGLAGLFGLWSMFAMMVPADSCTPEKCRDVLIGLASLLIFIGLPASVIGGMVGVSRAAKHQRPKAVPAGRSLAAVLVVIVVWLILMRLGTPSSMW